jgi:Mitochondrial carrier protein
MCSRNTCKTLGLCRIIVETRCVIRHRCDVCFPSRYLYPAAKSSPFHFATGHPFHEIHTSTNEQEAPNRQYTLRTMALPSPAHGEVTYDLMYYLKGAAAGGICCSVTHGALTPVDVVKTRVQLDPVKVR